VIGEQRVIGWDRAWARALYGPDGFYRRPEGPAGHFRTAAHAAAAELAAALHRLAAGLGCCAIVDVGAGRGELLTALAATDPAGASSGRARLHGVDVVARPPGLPAGIGWTANPAPQNPLPASLDLTGALLIGWELLDVVPGPILETDGTGVRRQVLVDPATGRERLGPAATGTDLVWAGRWWPGPDGDPPAEGDRVEVGAGRDRFWADLVRRAVTGGAKALLAVDYAHSRPDRPAAGSLTGFRAGRAVPPVPDGSMDLTTHVALDSVEAAGRAAGVTSSRRTDQGTALGELGVTRRELLDPGGLGGFGWLLQTL
jgi:SAM-dependent MidA family methyltransferase